MSEAERIVDSINKKNVARFGPLCDDCGSFEKYCRCESARDFEAFMASDIKDRKEWDNQKKS
jgi:hypothetical protein